MRDEALTLSQNLRYNMIIQWELSGVYSDVIITTLHLPVSYLTNLQETMFSFSFHCSTTTQHNTGSLGHAQQGHRTSIHQAHKCAAQQTHSATHLLTCGAAACDLLLQVARNAFASDS